MQATEQISKFIVETDGTNIPDAALEQAKAGIVDWIFVCLTGARQISGSAKNFVELMTGRGGLPESSLIGSSTKITTNQAALVNGFIGHIMDFDETCPKVRSHLFASIFPALLAVAEHKNVSGRELLTAFITGHEVAMRIGEAITPAWIKAGWHGTSLFGIFGSAAGCGKLFGLSEKSMRNALGLVCSMAGGVAVNFGSQAKPMHAGMGAERGLFAAQLAQTGITANQTAIEGTLGFYHAYNWGLAADDMVLDSLGDPWGLATPGMSSIKLYPCCHGLATNIECGIRIHKRDKLQLDDIEFIEMHSQPKTLCAMLSRRYHDTGENLEWGYTGEPRRMQTILPTTGAEAKFSKEYAFSRALKDGWVGMADLTDEAVNEPEIRKWMEMIHLFHNSELEDYSNQYPEHTAPHAERMIIHLKNGNIIKEEEIFIKGMTKRPLFFDDVLFKYKDCGALAGMDANQVDEIISMVRKLETVDSVGELVTAICGNQQ